MEKEKIKATGYIGKDHNYRYFENTSKSVINTTIKPAGDNSKWINITAWNANAEKLKDAIEKEGIKKITVTGKMKDKSFIDKNNNERTISYLQVDDFYKHKLLEIKGNVAKIDQKETKTGKAYTDLLIINDRLEGKKEVKELYNVALWDSTKKNAQEFKVGDFLAVKGEGTIFEYEKDGVEKKATNINAWEVNKLELNKDLDKTKNVSASKGDQLSR